MIALLGCLWISDTEQAERLGLDGKAGGRPDADADSDSDSDTDSDSESETGGDPVVEPNACVEGESGPNGDAPEDYTTSAATGSIDMVGIPSGSFCMGSDGDDAYDDEQPVHPVTLSRPFWIGKTELTQAQYEALTGETPSHFPDCQDCPVEYVHWYDAATAANALSEAAGLDRCYATDGSPEPMGDPYGCDGYRLPTEAEWEYAARGGEEHVYAGSDDHDAVAWTQDNDTDDRPHPVAGLDPNGWGLYDLSGNVWEWTGDWYDQEYYDSSPATDPWGPSAGSLLVVRGGSWFDAPTDARVAHRTRDAADYRAGTLGLRLARASP